jgi:hypothetical protein
MVLAMRALVTFVTAFWLGACGVVSATENSRGVAGVADVRACPNPARDVVHIAFGSSASDSIIVPIYRLRVTVHNATGRLVRKLRDGRIDFGGGDHGEITWEGRTDSGQRVPSGLYYIRIVRDGRVSVLKVRYIR